jgi:hypothetical protein
VTRLLITARLYLRARRSFPRRYSDGSIFYDRRLSWSWARASAKAGRLLDGPKPGTRGPFDYRKLA